MRWHGVVLTGVFVLHSTFALPCTSLYGYSERYWMRLKEKKQNLVFETTRVIKKFRITMWHYICIQRDERAH
jgi:hypothetical protein